MMSSLKEMLAAMISRTMWSKLSHSVTDNALDLLRMAILIGVIVISNSSNPSFQPLRNDLIQDKLSLSNQAYLKQAKRKAMDDLLVLAEMSAFLNVIGSSEVGISFIADFNVKVGQALHELTKVVERAAEICLVSMMSIETISVIAIASDGLAPIILQISLWSIFAYLLFDFISKKTAIPGSVITRLRKISMASLLVFICLHLILPYSIHLSSIASHHLINKNRVENSNNLSAIHGHLLLKGQEKELRKKAEHSIRHLKNSTSRDLKNKLESVISYLITNLALTLLELILLPVVILYGLYLFFRYLIMDTRSNGLSN